MDLKIENTLNKEAIDPLETRELFGQESAGFFPVSLSKHPAGSVFH